MSEKMSIHRGLAELKLLERRIQRAVGEGVYVVHNKHSNTKIKGMEIQDFKDKVIKSSYDKVTELIKRRQTIKSAIVKSNALTEVEIAGEKMTIAESIERKNSIQYDKEFLYELKKQYSATINKIEQNNSTLTERADEQVGLIYQNKDNIDTTKIQTLKKDYIEENTFDLIDPILIKDKIDKLEKQIDDFESEVDFKLSESNAITMIEV